MRMFSGMLTQIVWAAFVWPTPEISSFSPSTVSSATLRMAAGSTRLAAMDQLALRQRVLDEDLIDGLQIELGGQVHDREIFVVEIAVLLGRLAVVLHQMHEEFLVGDHVPVEVHRHEAGQLQEAGIDRAHEARLRPRHLHDDIIGKPLERPFLGELVDGCRIDAGVDRPAHQRHGRRATADRCPLP